MFKPKNKIILMVAVISCALAFVGLIAPSVPVAAEVKEFGVFCAGSEAQIERDKKVGSFPEVNVPYFVSCKSGVPPTFSSPPQAEQGAVVQKINVDCFANTVVQSSPPGRFQCRGDASDNSPALTDATVTLAGNLAESSEADTGKNLEADCTDDNKDGTVDKSECGIISYIIKFINILSAVVGVIIVAVITFRGIQYTFSRDNAQETAKAKDGIRDAVFAVVYYIFIVAFLQWIVPGGVF